jgi:hypothetical protein
MDIGQAEVATLESLIWQDFLRTDIIFIVLAGTRMKARFICSLIGTGKDVRVK